MGMTLVLDTIPYTCFGRMDQTVHLGWLLDNGTVNYWARGNTAYAEKMIVKVKEHGGKIEDRRT